MVLRATLGGPGVTATFTVTLRDGTLRGRGEASLRPKRDGSSADFSGTANITGGTGVYVDASARDLRYTGNVEADASTSTVHLNGELRY
jgi:hypothetical protein